MDHFKLRAQAFCHETDLHGQLLRLVVHDLATPINITTMILKRLRSNISNGHCASAELDKLERVNANVTEILNQVRRMLALTEGQPQVPLVVCDAKELIANALELHLEIADRKKISIVLKASSQNLKVLVEPVLFKSVVLGNLIQNALKFSHSGSQVEIVCESVEPGWISIQVIDYGIGIPEELLPVLFDSTASTHRKGTEGEGGSGFGLSLVKTFLSSMRGEIVVNLQQSQVKRFTCFEVRLPAQS